ncbi:MAG: baseplate assembly protein [Deferribacterales bacterium]
MESSELKALLKKVIEIAMPNLRKYYRVVRKAKVVATYASNGKYYCDVQPMRNDESVDDDEPVLKRVEIPVIWAGSARGIICPPAVGSHCDLEYYDGDPSFPRISNFRWHENGAPSAAVDELIIQQQDGVYIRICANKDVEVKTSGNIKAEGKEITLKAETKIILDAPLVDASAEVKAAGNMTSAGTMKGAEVENGEGKKLGTHRHPITDGADYTGQAVS